MKEGIFICPQITQIFEDQDFSTKLYCTERRAWKAFENVCRNFLGNENAENYSEILLELISSYSSIGCNMSLKLHFLNYILDFFSLKTWQPSRMNLVKYFIRIFPKLERSTVEKSVQICSLTVAAVL